MVSPDAMGTLSFRTASKPGLLLGLVMLVAGGAVIAWPPEILVHHPTMRPSVFNKTKRVEAVTEGRARFYGGGLVAAGVFIALFSLYSPRREQP